MRYDRMPLYPPACPSEPCLRMPLFAPAVVFPSVCSSRPSVLLRLLPVLPL